VSTDPGAQYRTAAVAPPLAGGVLQLLQRLGHGRADIGIAAVIAQACTAVQTCCAHSGQPHFSPATLPVITVGGLVQAALTPLFLPDRFQRWRGILDCSSPSE